MKLTMKKRFESYAKNYKRRKSWQRVVSMLTCIIVFCTTYALILPAITLSGEATCGMDEHVHSDACYEVIEEQILTCSPVHNHTADCYEEGTLICGCADFVLHTHDKNCFSESGVILCELAKLEEHTHTDDCYTVEEMVEGHLHEDACYSIELGECICGLEEQEGHTHDDACYGEQYLSCQEAEREGHTHDAACYGEATLSCTIEEDGQHTHGEACYTAELLCGETEDPGHAHGDGCYSRDLICGEEEREGHAHTDDCYEEVRTLICELEEDGVITEELVLTCTKPEVTAHTHTDSCYEITKDEDGNEIRTLICTELEVLKHQHSAECLDVQYTTGMLTCLTAEHVHTEDCFPEVIEEYAHSVLLADGDSTDETTSDVAVASMSILNVDAEFNASFSNATFDPTHELYDVKLDIEYTLNNDIFQKVAAGEYDAFHIELPDNMIIPDDLLDQVRYATDETQGGMVAFDYWFEKTADGKYVIHIDYRDDYVAEMVKDGSTGTYTISFKGKVEKDAVKDNGDIVLNWSDGTTTTIGKTEIEYPDNETLNYDIHTQKQGSYDIKNNTLTYTVKVYSDKGTPPNETISVTDILNLNGISLPENENPSVSVTDQNGNTVSGANVGYELKDGKPTISVTNLPALNAGGYYLITYTYEIDELAAGTQHWPNNSVTAEVPNPENDEPLESTTGTTVTVSKQMISKTGNYSAENGIITWTITVNASGDNIADYVLTDNMLQNAQSLTIVPADAGSYTLNRVDGKIQSILFNATVDTDNDGTADANYNTYTITYTTAQDQSTAGGYTSNDATLTPPSGSDEKPSTSGDINVWVPASGGIDKQFVDRDGNILNWSVTVTIPDGGIGKGTVIKDNTGYSWDAKADNHWMTPAQIYALNEALSSKLSGIDYTLEFSADGWNWDTYSEAISDTSTTKYYCWRITFNEDVPKDKLDSLTINYSTTADISKANNFVNTAKMGDYSDTANTEYKPAVAKLDRYYNTGTTNISSTDGVIGWYIRVAVDSETTSIDVTDYLPAGVTLTKLGVGTDGNAASSATGFDGSGTTGTLQGWNSVQGNYTISEYTDDNGNTAKQVHIDITPSPADGVFQGTEIYVYFECTIDDMPEPGESKSYTFTNKAVVDEVPVEQTQNVTVNIPATVVKMDSNGSTGDTSHSYGANDEKTVGWYVRVYLPEGATGLSDENPIVVTDDLPAGLKLTKIGIGGTMYDARYGKDYSTNPATDLCVTVGDSTSGSLLGTNNAYASTYEITTTDGNQDVVVNITNGGKDIAANSYIYIYYECEITEDAEGETVTSADGLTTTTTYKFENKATVEINGEPFGSDDHEQTIIESTVEEQELPLDKSVNFDAGVSQLQYTVLLNKNGDDLDPDADMIKVVDVMTHNVDRWWNTKHSTLISSSVKLYYPLTDTAGNILYDTDGNPLPDLTREVPADQWSWMFYDNYEDVLNYKSDQIVNTIEAWIPDGYAFVLKYIYAFDIESEWDTGFQVSNKVTLYGKTVTSDEVTSNEIWEYSEVTATATSSGTYTIHKVKEGNYNIVLPNAEFTVYTYSDNQPVLDENGNPVVYKSDNDGLVKISNEDYFQEDVIYYAMETKAPDGYFLPDEPTKVYFYFGGDNAGSLNLPSGAVDLNYTFGVAYIQNEVRENSISVNKVWMDGDGNDVTASTTDPESITFQLIQTDIYGTEVIYFPNATDDMKDEDKVYTISASNNWKLTIDNLPYADAYGNPYTYTAKEFETDGYISEITVDANGNITITNRPEENDGSVTVNKVWETGTSVQPVTVQLYQTVDVVRSSYTAYLCFADDNWDPQIGVGSAAVFTADVRGNGTYEITWDMQTFGFQTTEGIKTFYIDIFDPEGKICYYDDTAKSYISNYNLAVEVKTNGESVTLLGTPILTRSEDGLYTRIRLYNGDQLLVDPSTFVINENGSLYVKFSLSGGSETLPTFTHTAPAANTGGVKYGAEVTLDSSNGWSNTWSNLPKTGTDASGNLVNYSYYVVETSGGYDVKYDNTTAIKDGTITITNYPRTPGDIIVNKQWKDANNNDIPAPEDTIDVDLYTKYHLNITAGQYNGNDYLQEVEVFPGEVLTVKFYALDKSVVHDSGWTGLPSGWTLSHGDSLGIYQAGDQLCNLYEYTLVVPAYDNRSENIVIVQNHWENKITVYGTEYTLGVISWSVDHTNARDVWQYLGTYTVSADEDWQLKLADLPAGTYMLKEKDSNYSVTYQVGSGDLSDNRAELTLTPGTQQNVTITNSTATTEITVTKHWLDNGERYDVDMITFKLLQNGVEYSSGILYMDDNWTATIKNLPKYYYEEDANGNLVQKEYLYTVVENTLPGFKTTYSDNNEEGINSGTLVITNEIVTQIYVKKEWASGTTPTNVVVSLYKLYTSIDDGATGPSTATTGGILLRTVTLGENTSDGWDKTWKNLDLYEYDDDGNVIGYYSYYVVEESNGYVTTYNVNDVAGNRATVSGSVVITNAADNTEIGVEKQWTDSSATPVDVSLYQVYTAYPEHTHDYSATATVDRTCTTMGYTTYTCSCGHSYMGDAKAAKGHSWDSGVVTKEPTSTEDGTKVFTCTVCGTTREETISSGHEHSYTATVTAPTCTLQGYTTYTCACGESYVADYVVATGHSYSSVVTAPTCTDKGYTTYRCTCGDTYTGNEVAALGHNYTSVVTEPTATEQGYTTHTCTRCGDSYKDSYTDPTGDATEESTEPESSEPTVSGETVLLGTEVVIDNWETVAQVDLTPYKSSFSSGGYFTVYYSITDSSWSYFCVEFEVNDNGDYFDFGTQTNQSAGNYSSVITYDEIVSALSLADMSTLNYMEVGGSHLKVTKITWTPASTLSANSFNYTNRVYYAEGNSSNPLGGAYVGTKQVTPGTTTWWTDLPKYKLDENGNILGEYTYYVVETGGTEYDATYTYTGSGGTVTETEMSTGISSGKITVTNTQEYHYELPATGGSGTFQYTLGGIFLLMAGCVVLMYNHKKGRKGVTAP